MRISSSKNYIFIFIIFFLSLEAIFYSIGNYKLNIDFTNQSIIENQIQNIFSNISLEAQAFSIYDNTLNKKIYGKNDKKILPIASLAKIMTIVISLNSHEKNEIITIPKEAIRQDGDYGFFVDEKFNIEDLAVFTLIGSVNDGAFALAFNDEEFLDKMNIKAKKIGMEYTKFYNPTGLDIDNKAGAEASAEDVNIMATYASMAYPKIFKTSILPEVNIKSQSGFYHNIKNTNYILEKIPAIMFSKTGFTPLAGGNLTIIYKNNYQHNIAITVLGSSFKGRFIDMEKIVSVLSNLDYGATY